MTLMSVIQRHLTPDLLRSKYAKQVTPFDGHCYVASEVLWHLLPNKEDYKVMVASVGLGTHWWLQNRFTGKVLDVTAAQFSKGVLQRIYARGRSSAFITKKPSKRAKILMDRL